MPRRQRRGLRLVGPKEAREPYRVGETVPADGIYCAYHNGHRTSHEVTLLAGETFPPCTKCGSDVRFELLRPADVTTNDLDFSFRIRLYELPHPTEPQEEEKSA
jgi:hypothetical protein